VASYQVDARGDVLISLQVQPGAARAGIVGLHGDALKVKVAAAPERGRANAAVMRLLADELGVRPSDVEVVSGHSSRRKRVRVHGADPDRVARWFDRHAAQG
jgi:uncharacterized protein (TIGR00251 family)